MRYTCRVYDGLLQLQDVKHLQVTVHVDDDYTPEFFELLANSPMITEARLVDWSMTASEQSTLLYTVDGDTTTFAERAANTAGIDSVETSSSEHDQTYVLVVMRPLETPMFAAIQRASTQAGLIVRKPIIYRDGTMSARVVGDAGPLQRALEAAPDGVEVQIDTIRQLNGHTDDPVAGLSDGQREAVTVALELGYYNQPRGATHKDIAAELDCAPQTASNHLQKAEANIIRAVMDEFAGDA